MYWQYPLGSSSLTREWLVTWFVGARQIGDRAPHHISELDQDVTRTSVSYENRFGITIAAELYRPAALDHPRRE